MACMMPACGQSVIANHISFFLGAKGRDRYLAWKVQKNIT